MSEIKQQKVIVLLSLTATDKNLILNGIKIAGIFRKELCLLYNYKKKEKQNKAAFKEKIDSYIFPVKKEIPNLKISRLLVSEKLSVLPEKLADDFEAIIIIAARFEFSKYSKVISESAIPLLFVNEKSDIIPDYKKLILPIDFRSESSESALWSSYFGRFNQAGIVVIASSDKGKDEKNKVAKNVRLTKKLFQKFSIEHKIFRGEKTSFRNAFEALEFAHSSKSDLLIILGSSTITPLDWIFGLPERKIVKGAENMPVLIINPKLDNYILCD